MRSPPGSLLDQTSHLIVRRQQKYGAERGVPWGISESAYNARDLELTYQYENFGVPGLGLKRGLSEDLVVAPSATALAAMIDVAAAVQNYAGLTEAGARLAWLLRGARLHTDEGSRERTWLVVRAYMRITKECRSWRSPTSLLRRYAHPFSCRAAHASH
jgi:cyclic beta-1,2-glucan synthetase